MQEAVDCSYALTSVFLSLFPFPLSLKISKKKKTLKIVYLKNTTFSYFEDSVQFRLQEGIVTSSSSSPRPAHENRLKWKLQTCHHYGNLQGQKVRMNLPLFGGGDQPLSPKAEKSLATAFFSSRPQAISPFPFLSALPYSQ